MEVWVIVGLAGLVVVLPVLRPHQTAGGRAARPATVVRQYEQP